MMALLNGEYRRYPLPRMIVRNGRNMWLVARAQIASIYKRYNYGGMHFRFDNRHHAKRARGGRPS